MTTRFFHIPQAGEIRRQRAATAAEQAKRNPIDRSEPTMTELSDDDFYEQMLRGEQPAEMTDEEQQIWQAVFPGNGVPEMTPGDTELYERLFSDDAQS